MKKSKTNIKAKTKATTKTKTKTKAKDKGKDAACGHGLQSGPEWLSPVDEEQRPRALGIGTGT
jgi:hypothetical protein